MQHDARTPAEGRCVPHVWFCRAGMLGPVALTGRTSSKERPPWGARGRSGGAASLEQTREPTREREKEAGD